MLKCKEFSSGVFKGVDKAINLFLEGNKIKKEQIVAVQYSSCSTGTFALIIYDV